MSVVLVSWGRGALLVFTIRSIPSRRNSLYNSFCARWWSYKVVMWIANRWFFCNLLRRFHHPIRHLVETCVFLALRYAHFQLVVIIYFCHICLWRSTTDWWIGRWLIFWLLSHKCGHCLRGLSLLIVHFEWRLWASLPVLTTTFVCIKCFEFFPIYRNFVIYLISKLLACSR